MNERMMLCKLADYDLVNETNAGDYIIEIKYDGTRALGKHIDDKISMVNRSGFFIGYRYPEVYAELEKFLDANSVVDGEVCYFEPTPRLTISNFNRLLSREQQRNRFKISLLSKKFPCHYVIFDVLKWNGKDMTHLPIEQRQLFLEDKLTSLKTNYDRLIFPKQFKDLEIGWSFVKEHQLEGLILKKKASTYQFARSLDWLKLKDIKKVICKVDSFEDTGGGFTAIAGNIRVGVGKREYADQIRAMLTAGHKPTIEIAFLEITEGHNYRQPVFKKIVEGK